MRLIKCNDIQSIQLKNLKVTPDSVPMNAKAHSGNLYVVGGEAVEKTTFLRAIAALRIPFSGEILLDGHSIQEMSFEEFAPYRLNIGYFFPLGGLLGNRTMFENLMLPFIHHRANYTSSEKIVAETLKEFDLYKFRDARPYEIPGMARKMGCIARVKALDPQVILIDNLFDGVPETIKIILSTWLDVKIKRGGIVFLSEMDAAHAEFKGGHPLTFSTTVQEASA